jgi:RimJ/RimL family protein N-acetyltransferase
LTVGDWKDLLDILSDEELFQFVDGRPLGEEEILRWLENDSHVKLTTPNQPFCLGIARPAGGQLVGYLSLAITDPQRLQAELAVFLGRRHQRQGLAAEAVAGALAFCFEAIKLHRVAARCDARHAAACRLFEKAGMRREGECRKDRVLNGQWANTVWYALLGEEYRETSSARSTRSAG